MVMNFFQIPLKPPYNYLKYPSIYWTPLELSLNNLKLSLKLPLNTLDFLETHLKLHWNFLVTSLKQPQLQTDTHETPLQLPHNILLQMLECSKLKKWLHTNTQTLWYCHFLSCSFQLKHLKFPENHSKITNLFFVLHLYLGKHLNPNFPQPHLKKF